MEPSYCVEAITISKSVSNWIMELGRSIALCNEERESHSAVTTQTATFLFGGDCSRTTYEYLPKDSSTTLACGED